MKHEPKLLPCIPLADLVGCEDCQFATPRSVDGNCSLCGSIATFPIMAMLERNSTQVRLLELSSMLDDVLVH